MTQVQEFLNSQKIEYRESTDNQFIVKKCPLCGDDRWKFYIEQTTGCWDCKICGDAGNLYQLKGKLGGLSEIISTQDIFANKVELDSEIYEQGVKELETNVDAYNYLRNTRGFSDEIIKHFKLGCHGDWIIIPHFEDGKFWNVKYRNFKDKKFKRTAGQPSILFNIDNIDKEKQNLVIVESETDCIAAVQMGVKNVIGLTTGAAAFAPEWIPYTLKFKEIYVCLNSDAPGQKGARNLAEKLGLEKCKNVILPEKDVNEFLLHHEPGEFIKLLKTAKRFDVKNIKRLENYVNDLDSWFDKDGSINGLQLPFNTVNAILNGFKAEDLIILSGDTGIGKTTFSLNLLHNFIKGDHRCLGFFLEGKIMYYILRMMSIETKKKIDELRTDPDEWSLLKTQFADFPLYFYSGSQCDLDNKKLTDLLKAAVQLYDIEFVMIDNLQKFVKEDRDVVQKTSATVSMLKDLAVDLKIPILLIVHPRKPERGQSITMHDAKNSSTIYQDVDTYLILQNNKKHLDDEDDIYLEIPKNRMGEGGLTVDMVFEKQVAYYRERIAEIDGKPNRKTKRSSKKDEVITDTDLAER